MPSTDKYCDRCKFFVRSLTGATFSKCGAPDAKPMSGDRYVAPELDQPPYCSTMRLGQCGPEAKWFEAKETVAA